MEPVGIRRPIGKGHGRPIRIKCRPFITPIVMPGSWPYPYPSAYRPCMDGMKEEDLHKENYDPKQMTSSLDMDTNGDNPSDHGHPTANTTDVQEMESQSQASPQVAAPRLGLGRSRGIRHPMTRSSLDLIPPLNDPKIFQDKSDGLGEDRALVNSETDSKYV